MIFVDKILSCRDCGHSFNFSTDEQEFFARRGLANEPKRCPDCRVLAKAQREGRSPDTTTEVECAGCGKMARVPFRPRGDKPVYCTYCFKTQRENDSKQLALV